MTLNFSRVLRTRYISRHVLRPHLPCIGAMPLYLSLNNRVHRHLHYSSPNHELNNLDKRGKDPRVKELGREIENDFARIKDSYATPQNPIVLAHGLLGFDELHLAGSYLPSVQYWRGITSAMRANKITVITSSVPTTGSIEERAAKLGKDIASQSNGRSVNIVAHSMGGLDARYMISCLKPEEVKVSSLTTIATPHRGSAFADWCFGEIGEDNLPWAYRIFERAGLGKGAAFRQLTRRYMEEVFNPNVPDVEEVRYFSYGATVDPSIWSPFRQPHRIVEREEGPNDGLVSVRSCKWGTYKGTLVDVSHLDLINWTNRLKWLVWHATGNERKFNALAFYLDIADMLAKEGL